MLRCACGAVLRSVGRRVASRVASLLPTLSAAKGYGSSARARPPFGGGRGGPPPRRPPPPPLSTSHTAPPLNPKRLERVGEDALPRGLVLGVIECRDAPRVLAADLVQRQPLRGQQLEHRVRGAHRAQLARKGHARRLAHEPHALGVANMPWCAGAWIGDAAQRPLSLRRRVAAVATVPSPAAGETTTPSQQALHALVAEPIDAPRLPVAILQQLHVRLAHAPQTSTTSSSEKLTYCLVSHGCASKAAAMRRLRHSTCTAWLSPCRAAVLEPRAPAATMASRAAARLSVAMRFEKAVHDLDDDAARVVQGAHAGALLVHHPSARALQKVHAGGARLRGGRLLIQHAAALQLKHRRDLTRAVHSPSTLDRSSSAV